MALLRVGVAPILVGPIWVAPILVGRIGYDAGRLARQIDACGAAETKFQRPSGQRLTAQLTRVMEEINVATGGQGIAERYLVVADAMPPIDRTSLSIPFVQVPLAEERFARIDGRRFEQSHR